MKVDGLPGSPKSRARTGPANHSAPFHEAET